MYMTRSRRAVQVVARMLPRVQSSAAAVILHDPIQKVIVAAGVIEGHGGRRVGMLPSKLALSGVGQMKLAFFAFQLHEIVVACCNCDELLPSVAHAAVERSIALLVQQVHPSKQALKHGKIALFAVLAALELSGKVAVAALHFALWRNDAALVLAQSPHAPPEHFAPAALKDLHANGLLCGDKALLARQRPRGHVRPTAERSAGADD